MTEVQNADVNVWNSAKLNAIPIPRAQRYRNILFRLQGRPERIGTRYAGKHSSVQKLKEEILRLQAEKLKNKQPQLPLLPRSPDIDEINEESPKLNNIIWTNESLSTLSGQELRNILFSFQGRPELIGSKSYGKLSSRAKVYAEILRLQSLRLKKDDVESPPKKNRRHRYTRRLHRKD